MEWIAQVISAITKLAPAPLFAVGIAMSVLLFAPDPLAQTLGVTEVRASYRGLIGGAFIVSWSYLTVNFLWWLRKKASTTWLSRKKRLAREKYLHNLTPEERGYLAPYVLENINTQKFEIEDGIIGGLLSKEIVFRSSNVFDMSEGVPYNIQSWAKDYLRDHPALLEGSIPRMKQASAWAR